MSSEYVTITAIRRIRPCPEPAWLRALRDRAAVPLRRDRDARRDRAGIRVARNRDRLRGVRTTPGRGGTARAHGDRRSTGASSKVAAGVAESGRHRGSVNGTVSSLGSAPLERSEHSRPAVAGPRSPNPASRSRLGDVVAVLRALRAGPLKPRDLAARTGLHESSIYRTIAALRTAGAPIENGAIEAERGRPTTTYRLTVDGLRQWIG